MDVRNITPDIAIILREKISSGQDVIIMGDRTSLGSKSHNIMLPFLGCDSLFSQGPFILAGLLDCPVFLLFSMKEKKVYKITFEHFADSLAVPRKNRSEHLKGYMEKYVARLEHYVQRYPLQWYNFYNYWPDDVKLFIRSLKDSIINNTNN